MRESLANQIDVPSYHQRPAKTSGNYARHFSDCAILPACTPTILPQHLQDPIGFPPSPNRQNARDARAKKHPPSLNT